MKTKILSLTILFVLIFSGIKAQEPFKLFIEKDKSWNASIFEIYIKQYCGADVNKTMLENAGTIDIQNELIDNGGKLTTDVDEAINAFAGGKKVFFFVENAVFGNLETGTIMSGSWQRKFPMVSGFYIWDENKCFQNEGLNYHCGKKDNAHETRFVIMN
jgi:hypothetical protein